MKHNRDPLYRCAQHVRHCLEARASAQTHRLAAQLGELAEACQILTARHGRIAKARRRGWHLAAGRLQPEMLPDAYRIRDAAHELLQLQRTGDLPIPPLRAILDELQELQVEFTYVRFEPNDQQIVARTEPITLEEIELGPFALQLHLDRLAREPGSGCFECVALQPNPAANNASVTHPHVSDGMLCAGEATGPIRLALSQGRVCDAFMLVSGVLHTYNASSPYVSLEEWEGATCPECSDTVRRRDEMCFCDGCERDVCDGCMGRCDLCEGSCCHACLESDQVSRQECCPSCRKTCSKCDRTVDSDSFDEPTQLCPECLAEAEQESPTPEVEETVHELDESRESDDPSPIPAAAAPAPPESGEVAAA